MGRKRKAADDGKMSNKGKSPALDKTKNEEKENSKTAQSVLESKEVENNMPSPSNNLPPEQVSRTTNADSSSDLSYKSMYISSQTTIERLMAENCRLEMQLEFSQRKIEDYEAGTNAIRTVEDVILIDPKRCKAQEKAIENDDSAPDADNHEASLEKTDSKNASKIVNAMRVARQRKKNCRKRKTNS